MGEMIGADPDALNELAKLVDSAGEQLVRSRKKLDGPIHSVPWHGRDADRFRRDWDHDYGRSLSDASRFLKSAATELHRQAEDQRRISGDREVPKATKITPVDVDTADWDPSVTTALEDLGIGADVILKLGEQFESMKDLLEMLNSILEIDAISDFLKILGTVLDIAEVLKDFLADMAEHSHLPFEEALIHALVEASLKFAASQGIDAAIKALTQALLNAVLPGIGGLAAWAITTAIGMLLAPVKKAMMASAEGIFSGVADDVVEIYRLIKQGRLDDVIKQRAGDIANSIGRGAKNLYHSLNPFD